MKRWILRIIYAAGGLTIFLFVLYKFIFPLIVATESFRNKLETYISGNTGLDVKFTPNLKVAWDLIPDLSFGDLTVSRSLDRDKSIPLLKLKSAHLELDFWNLFNKKLVLPVLNFESGEINLVKEVDGRNNWEQPSDDKEKKQQEASRSVWLPEIADIRLSNIKISYDDKSKGQKNELLINSLDLKGFGGDSIKINSNLQFAEFKLSLNGESASIQKLIGQEVWPFILVINHNGLNLSATGSLGGKAEGKDALKLSVASEGLRTDLEEILVKFGAGGLPHFEKFKIKFAADIEDSLIKIDNFDAHIDDMQAKANFLYEMHLKKLSGNIYSENIDLTRFSDRQKEKSDAGKIHIDSSHKNNAVDHYIFTNEPLKLSHISPVAMNLRLDFKNFRTSLKIVFNEIKADIDASDDKFLIKNLTSTLLGGELSSDLEHNPSVTRLKVNAHNLDFEKISGSDGVKGGKLNLDSELTAHGESLRKIAESLDGRLEFKLTDVLLTSGGLFYSTSNLFEILNPLSKSKKGTKINCLLTRFNINNGIAESDGTSSKIEDVTVLGDGTINFKTESVSMGFVPRSSSVGAATLVPPLKLHGSLIRPSITPNPLRLAAEEIDNLQGIFTGTLGLAEDILEGVSEAAHLVEKSKPKHLNAGNECEEIIAANSGKLTTLVGGLVFGHAPPQKLSHSKK